MASAMKEWERYYQIQGRHLIDMNYIGKGIGRSLFISCLRCVYLAGFNRRDSFTKGAKRCQQEKLFS